MGAGKKLLTLAAEQPIFSRHTPCPIEFVLNNDRINNFGLSVIELFRQHNLNILLLVNIRNIFKIPSLKLLLVECGDLFNRLDFTQSLIGPPDILRQADCWVSGDNFAL